MNKAQRLPLSVLSFSIVTLCSEGFRKTACEMTDNSVLSSPVGCCTATELVWLSVSTGERTAPQPRHQKTLSNALIYP